MCHLPGSGDDCISHHHHLPSSTNASHSIDDYSLLTFSVLLFAIVTFLS
jgi:hypothetical protein